MSGKQHMEKFIKGKSWRSKTPLHLVHSDLMGPLEHPSISGSRYVLTFIDDYNRRIWVYFLKNKDEVFGKFKEFQDFVEKQSGKSIKILRTHNGKEYVNKEFDHYCKYN
jgi:transposase InsO family protein